MRYYIAVEVGQKGHSSILHYLCIVSFLFDDSVLQVCNYVDTYIAGDWVCVP